MKLYYHPLSPFVRKVMIAAHENGLMDQLTCVPGDTTDEALRQLNPLCKIPVLALGDGTTLYDSRVICEYLDMIGTGALIPRNGHDRLRARLLEALGDGISDAVLRISYETRRADGIVHHDVVERQLKAVRAGLAEAERLVDAQRFTLGEAAVVAAIVYVGVRLKDEPWRMDHPALAAWFDVVQARPSVARTAPEVLA